MSVTGKPLINGTAYTHADISLNVMGVPIIEVTEINYSESQAIDFNYGTGNQPVSRAFGNNEPSASITVSRKEFNKIHSLAPAGKIQNIPAFPIGVGMSPEDGDYVRDRLSLCKFKGVDTSSSQGNTNNYITLEISTPQIDFNV
jgi:hypothetical protein